MRGRESGGHPTANCLLSSTSSPTVTVRLSDMRMSPMMGGRAGAPGVGPMRLRATPATVVSTTVSLVVENLGWRTHEVIVLPLPEGALDGERVPRP